MVEDHSERKFLVVDAEQFRLQAVKAETAMSEMLLRAERAGFTVIDDMIIMDDRVAQSEDIAAALKEIMLGDPFAAQRWYTNNMKERRLQAQDAEERRYYALAPTFVVKDHQPQTHPTSPKQSRNSQGKRRSQGSRR